MCILLMLTITELNECTGQLADVKVALQKSEAERQTVEERLQMVQKEVSI